MEQKIADLQKEIEESRKQIDAYKNAVDNKDKEIEAEKSRNVRLTTQLNEVRKELETSNKTKPEPEKTKLDYSKLFE